MQTAPEADSLSGPPDFCATSLIAQTAMLSGPVQAITPPAPLCTAHAPGGILRTGGGSFRRYSRPEFPV